MATSSISPSIVAELRTVSTSMSDSLLSALAADFDDFSYLLRATWLGGPRDEDHHWWYGYGELWSARCMAQYLQFRHQVRTVIQRHRSTGPTTPPTAEQYNVSVMCDARDVIVLSKGDENVPDFNVSGQRMEQVHTTDTHIHAYP